MQILQLQEILQGDNGNRKVAYKNFAPFEKYLTEIDGTLVGEVDFINIAVSMYNLIEYSDNYSDTSVNLLQFKRVNKKLQMLIQEQYNRLALLEP